MKKVDFLDVTLCLSSGQYWPYSKPNNVLLYVNVNSNHPKTTIKQIPIGVQKRLSKLSANEELFNEHKGKSQEALKRAGYKHELKL